jgi:YD repeat-containing protein
MIRVAIVLALIALPMSAMAQGRTYYDASGKAVARSTTDSAGTTTTFDASGKAVSRETRDGTVYDAQSGRVLGKVTKDKR